MSKTELHRLASKSFEHPADKAALATLKNTAGFDRLVRVIMGLGLEPVIDYLNRSTYVRCDEHQCAELYANYMEAVRVLDIDPVPPLFLAHSPAVNAWTFGTKRPYVVVTSGLVEDFEDEEVQYVMGHELGHILAGHSLYRTVGAILMQVLRIASSVALLGLPAILLSRGLIAAFRYWMRTSELSSDRAGLLVSQDPNIAFSATAKLAGGSGPKITRQLKVDRFLDQAREFDDDGETRSKLIRFLIDDLQGNTHPFPVVRARELKLWVDSGAYEKILGGEYSRRPQAIVAGKAEAPEASALAEATHDLIQTSLARVFGIYTAPKIPKEKLLKAVERFADCDSDEQVVAYYEGSALAGSTPTLLTDRRLFAGDLPQSPIDYSAIASVERISGGLLRNPSLRISLRGAETKRVLSFHRAEIQDGVAAAIEAAAKISQED